MSLTTLRAPLIALSALPLLAACYVVPVHPDGRVYPPAGTTVGAPAHPAPAAQPAAQPVAPPAPVIFTARLYPSNEAAARTGIIAGTVTSPSDGRGIFSIAYQGDQLSGEATRTSSGGLHAGIANASSPRGAFVRCNYRMTNATQGIGECLFNDGARFQLHLGG
ncbi:MAG: hypothetical protein JNM79_06920 [Burkholderiales bacterium]|nr:hypothetical protein [Burkholderiales bacterium]